MIMKKNVLVLEFHNSKGELVRELSKCPARPDDVMAAMQFLAIGCDLVASVQEVEINDKGEIIDNPLENK